MNWSAPRFAALAGRLNREYGLAFPPVRRAFAEAAMRRVCDDDLAACFAEVSVGETYFFRDAMQLDVIRSTVLPAFAQRSGAAAQLRVWSAGCSSGEEAYSLAIVLEECGFAGRSQILATDASPAAIARARRGAYGAWSFRHDVESRRDRCFVRSGKRWSVAARYRDVDFRVHNVLAPPPASGVFDVILCRNVLLYFDEASAARAAHLLAEALAPGGWLLMSPTDPPPPASLGLESVLTPAGIAFRRPLPVREPVPPSRYENRVRKPQQRTAHARPVHPPRAVPDVETYVARALTLLDESRPGDAAAQARRALFLDRSLAVAHLTLARALRLTGNDLAAQRALLRGVALLEAQSPADAARAAGGATAGTLCAVAAAEFDLLLRRPS